MLCAILPRLLKNVLKRDFKDARLSSGFFFMDDLNNILQNKILLLDGPMGTMIQSYNLNEKDYRG